MKIGVSTFTMYPWQLNEMTLGAAEAMGADSLWTIDHMLGFFHPELAPDMSLAGRTSSPDAFFDPFCTCAALGPATKIPLGIGVTDATRRAAPDVARATLTLQHLCKGGFNLGVGSGEAMNLTPFGYAYERPVAITEEFLKTLRSLLDTGRMPSGSGRLGLPLESDAGRPKVWVAGHGPRMLRLTGQYADGWLPVVPLSPEEYGRGKAIVARHAAAVGRPLPESGLYVFFILGESRRRLEALFEEEPLGKLFAIFGSPQVWRRHGVQHPLGDGHRGVVDVIVHDLDAAMLRRLAPTIPFEVVEEFVFMGSVDEIAERLGGYAERGCQHVVLANLTGLVGGAAELQARMPDLLGLRQALAELTHERIPL